MLKSEHFSQIKQHILQCYLHNNTEFLTQWQATVKRLRQKKVLCHVMSALLSSLSDSTVSGSPQIMSFSSSGRCCEAADITRSIAVNTLPFLIPRGTLTNVAGVKTCRQGHEPLVCWRRREVRAALENVQVFRALTCHFSVSGVF